MTVQMDETKKQRLEERGWKIGTVKEFLGLSPEEEASIELRLVAPPQPRPPHPVCTGADRMTESESLDEEKEHRLDERS